MIYDLARSERIHLAIQSEKAPVGIKTAMRKCVGPDCNRLRSIAQFVGASNLCIRCVRRAS